MPPISGQDVLKALVNKKGFSVRKGKGDHVVVDKPTDPDVKPFVVPLKKELKKGTLNFIIKSSKDFKHDFYSLL
jgi:predicted RNA binding protein YcfA (HicA-like mRNA interferase family)